MFKLVIWQMKLFSQREKYMFYVVVLFYFFFVRFITVIRKLLPGSVPRATNHHIAVTVLLELDVLRTSMSQYLMFSSFQVNGLSELKKVEESQDGSGGEKLYNVYTSFCYHKSIFISWEVSRKGFRS